MKSLDNFYKTCRNGQFSSNDPILWDGRGVERAKCQVASEYNRPKKGSNTIASDCYD